MSDNFIIFVNPHFIVLSTLMGSMLSVNRSSTAAVVSMAAQRSGDQNLRHTVLSPSSGLACAHCRSLPFPSHCCPFTSLLLTCCHLCRRQRPPLLTGASPVLRLVRLSTACMGLHSLEALSWLPQELLTPESPGHSAFSFFSCCSL